MLYTLPVSLFGMSVTAAELPEMASDAAHEDVLGEKLGARLHGGLRRIAYFIVPSAVAFLAFGDVIAAALFETGEFSREDSIYVWGILAGSAVGLLASTMGRLYASAFYALHDTRTPLRFAALRVILGMVTGALLALYVPSSLGIAARWGAAGITVASGLAGWVEYALLRSALRARLGIRPRMTRFILSLWAVAVVSAAVALGVKLLMPVAHPWLMAGLVLGTFGVAYIAITALVRIDEARALIARVGRTR
jgi:putative peptidoglycan lipid II flippase